MNWRKLKIHKNRNYLFSPSIQLKRIPNVCFLFKSRKKSIKFMRKLRQLKKSPLTL